MPPATLTTLVSTLSPLLNFSPCINGPSCGWAGGGWQQGWANEGAWTGLSQRYAEGWAVNSPLAVKAELQGTGFSVLIQPTSFYNLTLSLNDTAYSAMADLSSTSSANITGLPFGKHSLKVEFQSRDTTRQLSQEGVARIIGIEVHREGSSVEVSTLDDSAWQTGEIALSAGWSLLSITNPSANVLNETQAALLMPLLSSAVNNSLAWTSTADATLGFNFSGTDLAVYGPLSPMVGSFEPFLDGLSLGVVRAGVNVDARDDITGGQLVWSSSGLADGSHRFEMRNAGDGGDGVLLVDSFCIAGVTNRATVAIPIPIPSSTLIMAPGSPSSLTAPVPSSLSTSSSADSGAISGSASIGIYIAAAVGGTALLGATDSSLILLTIVKWRRRRTPDVNGLSSSPAGPIYSGRRRSVFGSPLSSVKNPPPFRETNITSGSRARVFHQLAEDVPASHAAAIPIKVTRKTSLRQLSTSTVATSNHGQDVLDAWGLPKPAYERPLEPPEMSAVPNVNRPSIVSFSAKQVSATLRNADLGALQSRPKSSAAEIGDFGADASGSAVGNTITVLAIPGDRDSRSIYSDVLVGGPASPAFPQDYGHEQSIYSLGQYYDDENLDGQYDDNSGQYIDANGDAWARSRSRPADGLSITTDATFSETAPAPLTPPMDEAPSARRRNPTTDGTPDTLGNPLGNYF